MSLTIYDPGGEVVVHCHFVLVVKLGKFLELGKVRSIAGHGIKIEWGGLDQRSTGKTTLPWPWIL